MKTITCLPADAKCVTNAILTRGNRIRQGWVNGTEYYETFHYPGALNFAQIIQLDTTPEWAEQEA